MTTSIFSYFNGFKPFCFLCDGLNSPGVFGGLQVAVIVSISLYPSYMTPQSGRIGETLYAEMTSNARFVDIEMFLQSRKITKTVGSSSCKNKLSWLFGLRCNIKYGCRYKY